MAEYKQDDAFSIRANIKLRLWVTVASQDAVANTYKLRVRALAYEAAQQPSNSGISGDNDWSVTVEGTTWTGHFTFDYRPGSLQTVTLLDTTLTVSGGVGRVDISGHAESVVLGNAAKAGYLDLPALAQPTNAPTIGTLTPLSNTSAILSWTPPTTDHGFPVTGYTVQWATDAAFTVPTSLNPGNVTSVKLTALPPGGKIWARVRAINAGGNSAFSASTNKVIVTSVGDLDGWSISNGTLPAGLAGSVVAGGLRRGSVYPLGAAAPIGLLKEINSTSGSGAVVAAAQGIRRQIDGLTIGKTYALTGTMICLQSTTPPANQYRFAVDGIGNGATGTITGAQLPVAIPTYTFVATAVSHIVRIQINETAAWASAGVWEATAFYALKLTENPTPSPYRLQDLMADVSLADQFDIACATVGAAWWVDRANVTKFRQAFSQDVIRATFSDVRGDGVLEYVDIDASYDTKSLVNRLNSTNHGGAGTGAGEDVTREREDAASVALWGVREQSVDMSMLAGLVDYTNEAVNPGFEIDAAGADVAVSGAGTWTLARTNLGPGANAPHSGSYVLRCTSSTNSTSTAALRVGPAINCTPGEVWTLSWWMRANAGTITVTPSVRTFTGADGTGTESSESTGAVAVGGGALWVQQTFTFTVPAGVNSFRPAARVTAGTLVGRRLDLDDITIVRGAVAMDFNGNTADADDYTYEWAGTDWQSKSYRRNYAWLYARENEIIAQYKTPGVRISSIRWNAQEDPLLAGVLEVQDRVLVQFRGISQPSRIVGIRHEIDGKRWMVNLALSKL